MMATPSSLQDCYFYFYSSCTKGDECPFRHCELALGTETVCALWREGRCFRSNCKFRHMESRINRSMIPCYWENQPGGCRKPHCVFHHRKLRNGVQVIKDTQGLILPTCDGKISPKPPDLNEMPIAEIKEEEAAPDPSLAPVPPLVLSFDEGEESDTESVTSTPVKQGDKKVTNLFVKVSGSIEEKDFGIKTLEQIRMEKIHKESDSYYGAAYTSTPVDAPRLIDQHYPPKTEFLALPKDSSLDKSLPAPIIEAKLSGVDEENDLRGRLAMKRNTASNKVNHVKRVINFQKQNPNQMEDCDKMDFKIKTLEEIRREKENKQSKSNVDLPSSEEKSLINNMKEKTLKKLKINRKPLYSVHAVHKQDASAANMTETTNACLVSNGIKIVLPKSSDELILTKSSLDSLGKRKSDNDSSTAASKIIKLSNNCEQINPVTADSCKNDLQIEHPSSVPNGPSLHIRSQDEVSQSASSQRSEASTENEPSFKEGISDSPVIHPSNKSDGGSRKDNLIARSISVDDDLDELLGGDDMNMDEMDTAPSDDILLEIEEFLDS